jgi:hypothetical protein
MSNDPAVGALRDPQVRNFAAILMLSAAYLYLPCRGMKYGVL